MGRTRCVRAYQEILFCLSTSVSNTRDLQRSYTFLPTHPTLSVHCQFFLTYLFTSTSVLYNIVEDSVVLRAHLLEIWILL